MNLMLRSAILPGLLLLTVVKPMYAQVSVPVIKSVPQKLSPDSIEGLYIAARTVSAHMDAQGRPDGRIVTSVVLYNHTRYALSSVTLRLDLYDAKADRVVSSFPYTASTLTLPTTGKAASPLAPRYHMTASSGTLDPHLPAGQEVGAYWMELISAEGTLAPLDPALPPLKRLTQAVSEGDLVTAQAIGQTNPELIRAGVDSKGLGLLCDAAVGDHLAVASYLLTQGAAVDGPTASVRSGMTPMMWAINWQSARVVDLLLAHHPDLSRKNDQGQTALEDARRKAQQEGAGAASQHILQALEKAAG